MGRLYATTLGEGVSRFIPIYAPDVQGNVIVTWVSPGSPAAAAAMRPGDVIVGIAGRPLKGQADFYTRLWSRGPAGTEIPLDVLRDGRIQTVTVHSGDRERYYRAKPTY